MSFYSHLEELEETLQSPLAHTATGLAHNIQMLQLINIHRESTEKQEQEECAECFNLSLTFFWVTDHTREEVGNYFHLVHTYLLTSGSSAASSDELFCSIPIWITSRFERFVIYSSRFSTLIRIWGDVTLQAHQPAGRMIFLQYHLVEQPGLFPVKAWFSSSL